MIYIHALFVNCHFQVTSEQEDYARPFVDLLKNMHQTKNGQQQQQSQITPKISTTEYYTTGSGAIVANPVITTSAPAMSAPHASTIFCTVGMSGGSVTYTDIGKNKFFSSIFFQFFFSTNENFRSIRSMSPCRSLIYSKVYFLYVSLLQFKLITK